ncbi:MAG: competence protein ComEC [Elusimicrobia bacterium]|nr:MAG: competence protein ComEC [Elusimicrobiota bacterium]KAF0156837.1 MAG: competence protein ComEC [Elusimicrobiota bacterium]
MARSASNRVAAVLKSVIASFLLSVFLYAPARAGEAFDSLVALTAASEASAFLSPLPETELPEATLLRLAPGLSVYFVSVGQGDAIYMEFPDGKNALIDGGPASSSSGPLALFLKERGVSSIDHVVLTHPHADHYKGLQHVFSNYTVGAFYDTRVDNSGATGDDTLRSAVAALGVTTYHPAPGDTLDWSAGAEIEVLNSCHEPFSSKNSETLNDCSIVLRLAYGEASLLFTGDAGEKVEERLVEEYGDALRSRVLKVGHHGSRYSSTSAFLAAVRPELAYISVGKNNYDHPHADARSRLLEAGAEIFRTDLSGTQEFLAPLPLLCMAEAAE